MNLNIWSTYISTFTIFAVSIIYSICISIKYSQYLYFYRSHFEQRVSIVFAHESKIQKSLRIMIDAVHMSHMKSNITTWSSKLKKGGCYKIYKKKGGCYEIYKKKGEFHQNYKFFEMDACCHLWLFLKGLATLQNGRWSVGHSSQVDRKRWISLDRRGIKHLCKPSVWNRIKSGLDPVLQVSSSVSGSVWQEQGWLVANRERQNMNM